MSFKRLLMYAGKLLYPKVTWIFLYQQSIYREAVKAGGEVLWNMSIFLFQMHSNLTPALYIHIPACLLEM